ncbi:peptidase S8 and S53 subtilisin kexin sedolisin [Rhizobium leguminosarum bv. viciae]|uniref:S8 family serine peptidase n=1 Tax=Rhizobium leguminosarum TaxID=384 RepID=UPI00103D0D88|nr:S8 family serine peptidase [Rhizobium leguminosarum]TBY66245.1 peptidase S8 and S53 subtilisin kexin sedolisin [Rhizobium leguminosarum bv. viciae]
MANPLDRMRKLNSRLRCVANGDSNVNAVRAQQNGAVRLKPAAQKLKVPDIVSLTTDDSVKQLKREIDAIARGPKQKDLPKDVEVSVFVLLNRESAKSPDLVTRRNGRVGTATVSIADLQKLDSDPVVQSIELAETLRAPDPQIGANTPSQPSADRYVLYNSGTVGVAGKNRTIDDIGKNVLIGIIDVGGIDFAHEDFMDDAGNSRIIRIWDQGGDAFDPPQLAVSEGKASKAQSRGSEITAEHIAFALKEAKAARVSPYDLAPQSQQIRGSHATHVASIAAGRSGLCKRAKIAAVLLSLPDADNDRRKSFYDTTCLVDGLAYLFALAEADKDIEAISINISLGTNGGAHDGSELLSRWIDASMTEPGRSICVAAGNSGQDAPEFEGDTGIWSGRVHSSGRIPAAALRRDLEWLVIGNGVEDVSENELEIWYSAQDEFDVELFTPNGIRIGPVSPGQRVENLLLADRTVVSIYNVLSDPKNGDNRISIYLSPYMGEPIVGITAGSWKVRLTGKVVRNGAYNAWIERDDPSRGRVRTQWRLPSFFGPNTFVDHSTLSSLACGPRVIGVANLNEARELLNISSSQGPTRDGRMKPEIAAPGTGIVAACGFDPQNKWIEMTGTSMASPYVAGVAGLMLSLNPQLTAAQIGGIIQRTSRPLPGSGYEWDNGSGFGVIDPGACLWEVVRMVQPVDDLTDSLQKRMKGKS